MCSPTTYIDPAVYRTIPIDLRLKPAVDRMEERRKRIEAETRALLRQQRIGTALLLAFAVVLLYGIADMIGVV